MSEIKRNVRFSDNKETQKGKNVKKVIFFLKIPNKCDTIKITLESCFDNKLFMRKSQKSLCVTSRKEREHKMDYLAIEVAKYLIQLYFRSDKKYHCTLTKVEKLLAIAGLVCAKNGKRLFIEKITIKACGVGVDGLEFDLPSEIIDTRSTVDRSETGETDTPICPAYSSVDCVPNYFKSNPEVTLSDESKSLLQSVFEQFANYKARTLGTQIDGFKHYISDISDDTNQKRHIDQEKVKEFFEKEVNSALNQNPVYNFIKEH